MKNTYITIALATTLVFGAFIAGFFLLQKTDYENLQLSIVPPERPMECPPDVRMAQSTWGTYVNRDLGVSINYPEILVPTYRDDLHSVIFRVKSESLSSVMFGIDIGLIENQNIKKSDISEISQYRCSPIKFGGSAQARANINHGQKSYRLFAAGMSFEDVERVVNSIKFLE